MDNEQKPKISNESFWQGMLIENSALEWKLFGGAFILFLYCIYMGHSNLCLPFMITMILSIIVHRINLDSLAAAVSGKWNLTPKLDLVNIVLDWLSITAFMVGLYKMITVI